MEVSLSEKIEVAAYKLMGFVFYAVRDCGAVAGEPRQALIGATVVCPQLPQFPGGTFLFTASLQ